MAAAKKGKSKKGKKEQKPSISQPSNDQSAVPSSEDEVQIIEPQAMSSKQPMSVVSISDVSVTARKISPKDIESLKASIKNNTTARFSTSLPASASSSNTSLVKTQPCSPASTSVMLLDSDAESHHSAPSTNGRFRLKSLEDIKKEEEGRGSSMEPQAGTSTASSPDKKPRGKITPKTRHPVRKSKKAGLTFPVGRIHRHLKNVTRGARVSPTGAVYTAAVLEYLTAELVEIAGVVAKRQKRKSIKPRHIFLAIKEDEEIENLLGKVILPEAGTLPSPAGLLQRQGFPLKMLKQYFKKYQD